jgi:hypothetical protein
MVSRRSIAARVIVCPHNPILPTRQVEGLPIRRSTLHAVTRGITDCPYRMLARWTGQFVKAEVKTDQQRRQGNRDEPQRSGANPHAQRGRTDEPAAVPKQRTPHGSSIDRQRRGPRFIIDHALHSTRPRRPHHVAKRETEHGSTFLWIRSDRNLDSTLPSQFPSVARLIWRQNNWLIIVFRQPLRILRLKRFPRPIAPSANRRHHGQQN